MRKQHTVGKQQQQILSENSKIKLYQAVIRPTLMNLNSHLDKDTGDIRIIEILWKKRNNMEYRIVIQRWRAKWLGDIVDQISGLYEMLEWNPSKKRLVDVCIMYLQDLRRTGIINWKEKRGIENNWMWNDKDIKREMICQIK